MPRAKKNAKPFSIKMDIDVYERLEAYCEKSGQSKTLAIERAVNMFIDDYNQKMQTIESIVERITE